MSFAHFWHGGEAIDYALMSAALGWWFVLFIHGIRTSRANLILISLVLIPMAICAFGGWLSWTSAASPTALLLPLWIAAQFRIVKKMTPQALVLISILAAAIPIVYGMQLRRAIPGFGGEERLTNQTSPNHRYSAAEFEIGGIAYCVDFIALKPAGQPWDPISNYDQNVGEPVIEGNICDIRWLDDRTLEVLSRPGTEFVFRKERWRDVRILWHIDPTAAAADR